MCQEYIEVWKLLKQEEKDQKGKKKVLFMKKNR